MFAKLFHYFTITGTGNVMMSRQHDGQKLTSSYLHVPNELPCYGKSVGRVFNERVNMNPDEEMYVFYADKERKTYKQMQNEVRISYCIM